MCTLNLIETFKTSIYSAEHTKDTKLYFRISTSSKQPYFQKIDMWTMMLMLMCMVLLTSCLF